ncbi:MAG TPA: transposase [Gemmatimonadales bacterium]
MHKHTTMTTGRASLCALGEYLRRHCFFAPLWEQVKIPQKTVWHRPVDKLLDGLLGLLCGAKTISQSNVTIRVAPAVQRAFGRKGCADQSTIARTLQACTAENVAQVERVSQYYLKRYGQTPHHRFTERLLWVDVDVTPMPIGAQAEGSERTWMGRNRSKTGRKTLRFTASEYREILHETLLRGKASAVPALRPALGELETRLSWTRERRQRIVLRLDGGFGTTENLNWLLSRGYQVVAKISHSGRVRKLRQNLGPWQPTSSPGREIAAVLKPHRFCRATRQWVIRTPKAKGGYQYAVLVTTWTDLEPAALADAYDGRATIESSFCQDKQALGLVTRRQRRWEAQQMVLLLARLAHHLLLWGKQWLSRVPATRRRLRGYGLVRLLRDVWAVPGVIRWRRGWMVSVRFSPLHPLATPLRESFSALFRGRVRVGCLR